MASKRFKAGMWEYTVKRAGVLPKPLYLRFQNEAEGDAYCRNLEALLDKGIVPAAHQEPSGVRTIAALVRQYERDAHPSVKDSGALGPVLKAHGTLPLTSINAGWVDAWIAEMKRVEALAPATIRARVGALARATDWGMRKGYLMLPDHPFRSLPDGYAQYTKMDAALAGGGRVDVERDRRLERGEHERILAVIEGGVLKRTQRPRPFDVSAARLLYTLALETAMRLREMYTITLDQVDLERRTIFLDRTKNGDKRQIPLSSVAIPAIRRHLVERGQVEHPEHLFPWWDGSLGEKYLVRVTNDVSQLFHCNRTPGIFDQAGCKGLKFHDLRHEATSRLFERTQLSDLQIAKITGHKSLRMLARYANLRGSDLASKMW